MYVRKMSISFKPKNTSSNIRPSCSSESLIKKRHVVVKKKFLSPSEDEGRQKYLKVSNEKKDSSSSSQSSKHDIKQQQQRNNFNNGNTWHWFTLFCLIHSLGTPCHQNKIYQAVNNTLLFILYVKIHHNSINNSLNVSVIKSHEVIRIISVTKTTLGPLMFSQLFVNPFVIKPLNHQLQPYTINFVCVYQNFINHHSCNQPYKLICYIIICILLTIFCNLLATLTCYKIHESHFFTR